MIHTTQNRIAQIYDGDQTSGVPPGFQFTAAYCPETDRKMEGNDRRDIRKDSELYIADRGFAPSDGCVGSEGGATLAIAEPNIRCSTQEETNGVATRTDQASWSGAMQEDPSGTNIRAVHSPCALEEGEDGDADMVLERGSEGGAGH